MNQRWLFYIVPELVPASLGDLGNLMAENLGNVTNVESICDYLSDIKYIYFIYIFF